MATIHGGVFLECKKKRDRWRCGISVVLPRWTPSADLTSVTVPQEIGDAPAGRTGPPGGRSPGGPRAPVKRRSMRLSPTRESAQLTEPSLGRVGRERGQESLARCLSEGVENRGPLRAAAGVRVAGRPWSAGARTAIAAAHRGDDTQSTSRLRVLARPRSVHGLSVSGPPSRALHLGPARRRRGGRRARAAGGATGATGRNGTPGRGKCQARAALHARRACRRRRARRRPGGGTRPERVLSGRGPLSGDRGGARRPAPSPDTARAGAEDGAPLPPAPRSWAGGGGLDRRPPRWGRVWGPGLGILGRKDRPRSLSRGPRGPRPFPPLRRVESAALK